MVTRKVNRIEKIKNSLLKRRKNISGENLTHLPHKV